MEVKFEGELWKGRTTEEIQSAAEATTSYAEKLLKKLNEQMAYDTGKMSRSWDVTLVDNNIKITNSAPYSGFVVYGTRKMKPRPILQQAMPKIEAHFKSELADRVGSVYSRRIITNISRVMGW